MATIQQTELFNRRDRAAEGWYWAIPAAKVPAGAVVPVRLLGKDLAIWRDQSGRLRAFDAYCPHMGAHLAEGSVDGDHLRCFFHWWRFDAEGSLVEIPCQPKTVPAKVRTWPVAERYGLIWVWTGTSPRHPVPYIPELADEGTDAILGNHFFKGCHPNVVMINAIDEQHFASVHNLIVDLHFDVGSLNENAATFSNTTPVPKDHWIGKLLGPLYSGPLTYKMCYWNGTTGSVTVGPDAWHFHIVFALRPTDDGRTEGQTVLITRNRPGVAGRIANRVALFLSEQVGNYFAKGDTEVFESIRWSFQTPIRADRSIIHFIQHLDQQPAIAVGTWDPVAPGEACA